MESFKAATFFRLETSDAAGHILDWINPRPVENVNSDNNKDGTPTVARDGTLYFFSDRNAEPGKNSTYVAKLKDVKYQNPVMLPPPVNSGASDTSPFISPDGRVLLFYSTRPGGKGSADLYVSYNRHGRWTDAQNLGSMVNSSEEEDNPVVSPDGKQFFFGRNGNIPFPRSRSLRALIFVNC